MTKGTRVVLWTAAVLVVTLVAAVGGGIWMTLKRPFAVDSWLKHRALANHGLEREWASFAEGRVAVWTGGQGPTLVLLHGAGDHAGTWAEVVPTLIERYRLVLVDLPGHAASDPQSGPLSVATVLAGVEAALEQHSQGPVSIVGNSLGGWIAMLLAADSASEIDRLVLVSGGALRGENEVNLLPSNRAEAEKVMALTRSPKSPKVPGFVLDDLVRLSESGPVARLYQTANEMDDFLLEGRLEEVHVPVDLLWGADDQIVPLSYAERLQEGLAATRLTVLPDCGHVPHRERPAFFAQELARVLAEPPPVRQDPPDLEEDSS